MKTHLTFRNLIVLILVLGLAACTAPAAQPATIQAQPTQPPATQVDLTSNPNAEIVLNMVERLNAGDVDGSLAYFSDDALIYFIGLPPTGMEIYQGREALRPVWDYSVSDNFEWEIEITKVDGDLVFAKAKTWMDFTRGLGVAPNEFIDVYEIKDGKIATYNSTITEQALAEFKPALYKAIPPEPTNVPPAETPASEVTVTFADGACTYDGPLTLKAGELIVNVDVKDQDREKYGVTFFTLDEGKDMLDLMASTSRSSPPAWSDMIFLKELNPNESQTYRNFIVDEGLIYLVCWSKPPDLAIGNAGPFMVVP